MVGEGAAFLWVAAVALAVPIGRLRGAFHAAPGPSQRIQSEAPWCGDFVWLSFTSRKTEVNHDQFS